MSAAIWKVKANKNNGKIIKGMEVEILIKNRIGIPSVPEIRAALKLKYNIDVSGVPPTSFDYYKQ